MLQGCYCLGCCIFGYGRRDMFQTIWDYSCERHIYVVSVLGGYYKRNLELYDLYSGTLPYENSACYILSGQVWKAGA